ncbi:MAG: GDP-mannose 4,6-dehydratase [Thermodesulfobacteriota bacterium]|nr:GDP-mannose 4,6-dehydratase [Thermodesulfobacteriota bacterium]
MKKLLITGGSGFIGSHFVEYFLKKTDWEIIIFDKLTYASYGLDRIRDIKAFDHKRVKFFSVDIRNFISKGIFREIDKVNYIIHLAAETHVDASMVNPKLFIESNIIGTLNMLEFARRTICSAFNYFSTDEVFGPARDKMLYKEWDRYNSTNFYAASKAGAEELCLAYANIYKLPLFITHTMNVFGERQHPEKFIPMCIKSILQNKKIKIHSDPTRTISGSRHYIHARNVAQGIHFLLDRFEPREKYNIVGETEISNLDLAKEIAHIMKMSLRYTMVDFHSSRPGHDLRYALDGNKLKEMGWNVPMEFEQSLRKTVEWTMQNLKWLET